jgi:hypothetical protein
MRYLEAIRTLPLTLAIGCGGKATPVNHRPVAVVCSQPRADVPLTVLAQCIPAEAGLCPYGECNSEADCTAGANGRCGYWSFGPPLYGMCSYDECFSDSDCDAGLPCECRRYDAGANMCAYAGNCRIDSDCSPGGFCSPSGSLEWCEPEYFCHTSADTCVNDSDCSGTYGGCNFDSKSGHWDCASFCGPIPP